MRVRGLAVVVSIAAASAGILAQDKLTFRTESNYVEVDAIVTDAQGATVRGLTAADFALKEDRKPQAIATFDFIDLPTAASAIAGVEPRYRPDMDANMRVASGRVYLIFLDQSPAGDFARLREQATQFVQQFLLPNDVAAVWTAGATNRELTFTNDKTTLMKPIDAYTGISGSKPANTGDSQQGLGEAVTWLASIQGRRKSLILFTPSIKDSPRCIGVLLGYPYDLLTGLSNSGSRSGEGALCEGAGWMAPMTIAAQSDVHIYAVDTTGLSGGFGKDDTIVSLSEATGGLALINSNDYHKGFAKIVQDNSQYYVLGYDAPKANSENQFHEINLTVARKGLTVRARKGYGGQ